MALQGLEGQHLAVECVRLRADLAKMVQSENQG